MTADNEKQNDDWNVNVRKTLDVIVETLDGMDVGMLQCIMALLNNPTKIDEPIHNTDFIIDETVSTVNSLLEQLDARQQVYALAMLNYIMNHHFEKITMHNVVKCIVCTLMEDIISKMESEKHD